MTFSKPAPHLAPLFTLRPSTLLTASLLCLASYAQAQNIADLYTTARQYDATYQSARANAEAGLAKADQAKALILPTVGLGGQIQRKETHTANPTSNSTTKTRGMGVEGSMPLFDRAKWVTVKQSKKQTEFATIQLQQAEQDLIVRTAQAYFDVLAAQDNLKLAQTQKKAVGEQLAFAKQNFEVGTATITDSREAQARFDLSSAQESAAEFDLINKRNALEQLVGQSPVTPWPLKDPFTPPPLQPENLADWQKLAADNSNVRAARLNAEVADMEVEKARAGHWPTVDLTASHNIGRQNPNVTVGNAGTPLPVLSGDTRSRSTTAAVNLKVPLFAGFAIQNQVKEKLALQEKARSDLLFAERSVLQGTRQAYYGAQSLQAQVNALEAAQASSLSALEANKLGYEVGVRINIDVLNAQTQLFQTQRDLAKARYDLLMTQLKLKQAAGTLGPDDVQKINDFLRPPGTNTATLSGTAGSATTAPVVSPAPTAGAKAPKAAGRAGRSTRVKP